ncbi:MAG: site-2 protease family protein [Phycisphaerales bacterium]|nr:site-2 protease family protein [Phycisphaerales bacterium]
MLESLGNVVLVMAGFGLLILVHEAGHFLAAKWANIRTDAFAIGFGPVLVSYRRGVGVRLGSCDPDVVRRAGAPPRALTDEQLANHGIGETEYSLRVFPLGGFVRMLGQDDVDPSAVFPDPRAFNRASIGRRMVVISAGVVMNLLLAAVLFVIAFSMGVHFDAPVVGSVRPGSAAELAVNADGDITPIKAGDRIVRIDGAPTPTFADVQVAAAMAVPGSTLDIELQRGEATVQVFAEIQVDPATDLPSLGVAPAASTTVLANPAVKGVLDRTVSQWAVSGPTPQPGWTLVGLGPTVDDLRPVELMVELEDVARRTQGQTFAWGWRDGEGTVHTGTVVAQPMWQRLRYPDATGSTMVGWEEGLIGLVPMIEISSVVPGSVNDGVLQAGDLVLEFAGINAPRMREFREGVLAHGVGDVEMRIERGGTVMDVTARIVPQSTFNPVPKMHLYPAYAWHAPRFSGPMPAVAMPGGPGTPARTATPAADASIAAGARFAINGQDGVSPWIDLWQLVHGSVVKALGEVQFNVIEEGATREVALQLDDTWTASVMDLHWQSPMPVMFFEPLQVERSSGGDPIEAVRMGLHETWNFVVLTYVTIDRLFRGTVGVEQLHGPVGIVHLGTRIADRGIAYMLFFLALISVNLAVLNFLPLPIVDGGLMLYLVYEKVKGEPPSIAFQNGAALVGLLLIGSLFMVTFYNDIVRLMG